MIRFGVNKAELKDRLEEAWLQSSEILEKLETFSNSHYIEPEDFKSLHLAVEKHAIAINELLRDLVVRGSNMEERFAEEPDKIIDKMKQRRIKED